MNKQVFIAVYCLVVQAENRFDAYMIVELELHREVSEIISSRNTKYRLPPEELIVDIDRCYETSREEHAGLDAMLWWLLHERERPK